MTGARGVGAVYDASIESYLDHVGADLSAAMETPADLAAIDAVLAAVQLSAADGEAVAVGRVLDAGCGPARVAARAVAAGVGAVGVDVSAAMLAAARQAHPAVPVGRAALSALPVRTGAFAAVVAWYSIIHTAPADLAVVLGELARVVRPGGPVLVAFQAGADDALHRADAHGSGLPLTSHRHDPDTVAAGLAAAGLDVVDVTVRPPERAHEVTPQAVIHARRPPLTR